MATLDEYKAVMPTVFSIATSLTKASIDTRMAGIPTAPEPKVEPAPTASNISQLFAECYATPKVEDAIAKAGGIRKLAAKYGMTRDICVTIIREFEAARVLYQK
jgi:hypothetical protein